PKEIKIGRDGLIVKRGFYQGLLLPQVPVEWNWDTEEFLCQTCFKAGLPQDCWLDDSTEVYRFKGQIFEEKDGEIVEKKI
ncbi:MAG: TIGR00296 family protein, partial [Candidatus Methanolliviera hydrocarbonicum]